MPRMMLLRFLLAAFAIGIGLTSSTTTFAQPPASVTFQQVDAENYPKMQLIIDVADAAGTPVTGIALNEVQITEQGNRVSSVSLTPIVEAGLNLAAALTIDVSGSMQGAPLDRAKAAAIDFVNRLGPQDQAAVVSFGSQVNLWQGFTGDKELLRQRINALQAVGNTRLNDALFHSAEVSAASPLPRRVIVLLSDGDDTSSTRRLEEGINLARSNEIAVFTVGVGAAPSALLQNVSSQTGGIALSSPSPDQLGQAFETVSTKIRSSYVLSYTASKYAAAPDRSVRVTVNHSGGSASGESTFRVSIPSLQVTVQQEAHDGLTEARAEIGPDPIYAAEVHYSIDGRDPRPLPGPPYTLLLTPDREGVTGNEQRLRITVVDLINRTVQADTRFRVGTAAAPVTSASVAAPEGILGWVLLAISYVTASPIALVALVVILAGLAAFVGQIVGSRRGIECPACGTLHSRSDDCPLCGPRVRAYVRPLGEMLLRAGVITSAQLENAVATGRDQGRRLGEVLINSQIVNKNLLHQALQIQARTTSYALRYQRLSMEQDEELPLRTGLWLYGGLTIAGLLLLVVPLISL